VREYRIGRRGEVEVPVTEAADGAGDVGADRGQVGGVDRMAFGGERVGGGGDVARGLIDDAVGEELIELDEFLLVDG